MGAPNATVAALAPTPPPTSTRAQAFDTWTLGSSCKGGNLRSLVCIEEGCFKQLKTHLRHNNMLLSQFFRVESHPLHVGGFYLRVNKSH
jgi:hypothetical protein